MPTQPSFSTLLLLLFDPSQPRHPRAKRNSSTPQAAPRAHSPVPLATWLQAGGTGPPPPSWASFLARARRRTEVPRLDREAAAAWDAEKNAASKAVEEVWGKRPGKKELRVWYRGYVAAKGGTEGNKRKEDGGEKGEGGKGEAVGEPVMSGGNGDGEEGGDGGRNEGRAGTGDGHEERERQGNAGSAGLGDGAA